MTERIEPMALQCSREKVYTISMVKQGLKLTSRIGHKFAKVIWKLEPGIKEADNLLAEN